MGRMLGKTIPKDAHLGAAAKVGMFVIIETRRAWFGRLARRRRGRLGMGRGRACSSLGLGWAVSRKKGVEKPPAFAKATGNAAS